MKKKYEAPKAYKISLNDTEQLMTASYLIARDCNCGCEHSDVFTGHCGCNNGQGCPGCSDYNKEEYEKRDLLETSSWE